MNTAHTLTALALAALLSTSASAQERRRDARDDDQRPNREELLKRFDTNKDGQLDQKEREAARKARGQRGDQKRSGDDEKGTPPRQRGERPLPPELLKRFDTNKDGKLDEAERAAARKALGQRGDRKRSGEDQEGTPPRQRGERPLPPELLKRFDTNQDGKLDEAERAAARKALGQRGDRKRSGDDEQGAPPRRRGDRPIPPEILKRFDKNKDGKLDQAERAAAREALAQRRGGDERRRRGAGGGGDGEEPPQRRRRGEDGPPKVGGDKGGDQ